MWWTKLATGQFFLLHVKYTPSYPIVSYRLNFAARKTDQCRNFKAETNAVKYGLYDVCIRPCKTGMNRQHILPHLITEVPETINLSAARIIHTKIIHLSL